MNEKPTFRLPSAVLSRKVGKQMVLLNLATEQYYGLNEVGADMVSRLISQPLGKALQSLAADYDTEPERLSADVDALVESLMQAGLLERVACSPNTAVRR